MTPVADVELPTPEVAEEARTALRPLAELVRSKTFRDVKLRATRELAGRQHY